jgi:dihydroceramidase
MSNQKTGYWGPPTSTIDWCEENYAVTYYVAEFMNTLSSLILFSLGCLGIYWNYHHLHAVRRHIEPRMLASYGFLVIVGCGSTLFHGTLLYSFQLLDELPMLYVSLAFLYCLLERKKTPTQSNVLNVIIVVGIAMTGVYLCVPDVHLFENLYGILVVYCIVKEVQIILWSSKSDRSMLIPPFIYSSIHSLVHRLVHRLIHSSH